MSDARDEPVRRVRFDPHIQSYQDYVPSGWAESVFDSAKPSAVLDRLLTDLVLGWRTTAYTAQMPAAAVNAVRGALQGYVSTVSPDSSIVTFADNVIAKVSRRVPELIDDRELRGRLVAELASAADDFRAARSAVRSELLAEPFWNDFLQQPAFVLAVWASQRVSYVSFYNGYEAFLVQFAKVALGDERLRATDKQFKVVLRDGFETDLLPVCWSHAEINLARLVRHALSHAGGRETEDLSRLKPHNLDVVEGVIQIQPADNHNLLRRLMAAVDTLVAAAKCHPKFAATGPAAGKADAGPA